MHCFSDAGYPFYERQMVFMFNLKVKRKMLQEKVGETAGVIWNVLNGTNGLTLKDIKSEAKKNDVKLLDKDAYLALGWLLRENKVEVTEDGKDLFIKLI